jgi:putative FmdB family regulatory protein
MPTYDYRCQDCGYSFEKLTKVDDRMRPTEEPCPNCSKSNIQFIIGAPHVGDPVAMGAVKLDPKLRRKFEAIRRAHPGSTIKDY